MPNEAIAGRFVLVVDDVAAIAHSIARALLERRGLEAIAFTHGSDALAYCDGRRPWLALLDVCMPGIDGVTLAWRLRATDPRLPIVFVTGTPDDIDRDLGPPLHTVRKPCTIAAILGVVDSIAPV